MNRRQKKKKEKQEQIKQAIDKVIGEKTAKAGTKSAGDKAAGKKAAVAKVVIDCANFETKARIHEAFHNEPAFPEYQGNNLDAMFDMLSEIARPTELTVKNLADWEAAPDSFKNNIKKLLERADRENPNLTVIL